jgi:hypothetical protein
MFLQPTGDRSRLVYRVTIGNQVHLPLYLLTGADQATQKLQKHWRCEALPKNPIVYFSTSSFLIQVLPRVAGARRADALEEMAYGPPCAQARDTATTDELWRG